MMKNDNKIMSLSEKMTFTQEMKFKNINIYPLKIKR